MWLAPDPAPNSSFQTHLKKLVNESNGRFGKSWN